MKRLNYLTIESTTKFCPLISGEDSPDNVNRSTDVLLTGDMAEDVESLLTSVSLEALKDSIRPALTVNTYYGSNLRLRSASGSIIGRMADNETVTFAGDIRITRDANGQVPIGDTDNPPDGSVENPHVWFKVTTSGGQTGWASAEYLEGSLEVPEPEPVPLGPTFRLDPDPEPGPIFRLDPEPDEGPTFRLDPEPDEGPDFRGDPGPDEEPDFRIPPAPVTDPSFSLTEDGLLVLPANLDDQLTYVATTLGRVDDAPAARATLVTVAEQELGIEDELAFLNYANLERLNPAEREDFTAYAQEILTNPTALQDWAETNPEPLVQAAFAEMLDRQQIDEQTRLFVVYLQANDPDGLMASEYETLLGPVLNLMQTENLNLETALNRATADPTLLAAQRRLRPYFINFNRDYALLDDSRLDALPEQNRARLAQMVEVARDGGNYALANHLLEDLLQETVDTTSTSDPEVIEAIETAENETIDHLRAEITLTEIRQSLQAEGFEVSGDDDPRVREAWQLALAQASKRALNAAKLNIYIEYGVLDVNDDYTRGSAEVTDLVSAYRDLNGIDIRGVWDPFQVADATFDTLVRESITFAVITVATMGVGLAAGLAARGTMAALAARAGMVGRIGRLGQTVPGAFTVDTLATGTGFHGGYSLGYAAMADGNFSDNFFETIGDGNTYAANMLSAGVFSGLRGLAGSQAFARLSLGGRAAVAAPTLTGVTYGQTGVMSGEWDPTEVTFRREFLMNAAFNTFAAARGFPEARNLAGALARSPQRGSNWIINRIRNRRNPAPQPNPARPNPRTQPSPHLPANRPYTLADTELFTAGGNLRFGRLRGGDTYNIQPGAGQSVGLYEGSRSLGTTVRTNANRSLEINTTGQAPVIVRPGHSHEAMIGGQLTRITNRGNVAPGHFEITKLTRRQRVLNRLTNQPAQWQPTQSGVITPTTSANGGRTLAVNESAFLQLNHGQNYRFDTYRVTQTGGRITLQNSGGQTLRLNRGSRGQTLNVNGQDYHLRYTARGRLEIERRT